MKKIVVLVLFLLPLTALTGIAVATDAIGVVSSTFHARGTHAERLNIHSKAGIKLKTKHAVDFVTHQIVLGPGGNTGWHSHPGPVLVTVKSGSLRLVYADDETCQGRVYEANQSFVDRGDDNVHIALNAGVGNLEFWATYLVPGAPGTPVRTSEPSPGTCPF